MVVMMQRNSGAWPKKQLHLFLSLHISDYLQCTFIYVLKQPQCIWGIWSRILFVSLKISYLFLTLKYVALEQEWQDIQPTWLGTALSGNMQRGSRNLSFSLQMSHWEREASVEGTACQYFQHNHKQINAHYHI